MALRKTLRTPLLLLAAGLIAGCATAGAGVQSAPGIVERTIDIELVGDVTTVDTYQPESPIPHAVVLLAHGFSRNRATLAQLALDLAGAGFAVVVPDLPHFANPPANARFLRALAEVIERRTMTGLDFAAPRIVFAGFSAGGSASLLAAASHQDALGWIGLDPVDRAGRAAAAAPGLSLPAFVIRAPPSSCNAESNFAADVERLPNLAFDRIEPDASHCDFETPTDIVCTLVCGTASPDRQRTIRAAVVAAVKAMATQ